MPLIPAPVLWSTSNSMQSTEWETVTKLQRPTSIPIVLALMRHGRFHYVDVQTAKTQPLLFPALSFHVQIYVLLFGWFLGNEKMYLTIVVKYRRQQIEIPHQCTHYRLGSWINQHQIIVFQNGIEDNYDLYFNSQYDLPTVT